MVFSHWSRTHTLELARSTTVSLTSNRDLQSEAKASYMCGRRTPARELWKRPVLGYHQVSCPNSSGRTKCSSLKEAGSTTWNRRKKPLHPHVGPRLWKAFWWFHKVSANLGLSSSQGKLDQFSMLCGQQSSFSLFSTTVLWLCTKGTVFEHLSSPHF